MGGDRSARAPGPGTAATREPAAAGRATDEALVPLRLLLVEDSQNDSLLVLRELERTGFRVTYRLALDEEQLRSALREPWDIVICDYRLPQLDAPTALAMVRAVDAMVPFVVISGSVGEDVAVAVMRAGAQDFVVKDRMFRLGEIVRRERSEAEGRRQRAAAEAALRTSEEQLRLALDAARMGIWDWNVVDDVMRWSPNAIEVLGASLVQAPSYAAFLSHVHPEDRDAFDDKLRACLRGGAGELAMEMRVLHSGRDVRWVDVRGRVFVDDRQRPVRMLGTVTEATERRVLEDSLAHSQKMALMGRLAGGIAHDFNNLLTVIRASCQLVELSVPAEHEINGLLGPVVDAAERATALTRQLLMFSRPEALAPKVLDVNAHVLGLGKLLPRLVGEDVEIRTELGDGPSLVRMDPVRCEQVLVNLAVNARDAMPRGGVLTIATTRVRPGDPRVPADPLHGDWILLEVSDTGEGMTEEVRARIFEPFFTTKAAGHGTGLGLTTCLMAVKQAGGVITVRSDPGLGTTFIVALPACEETAEERRALPRAGAMAGVGRTVLLVEDDDLVRAIALRTLNRHGYDVLVAADSQDALATLDEHHGAIDLLVTDVVMPGMNGVELAERARARRPGLRVLFTSGYSSELVSRHGLAEDAPMLLKPYTALELGEWVHEAVTAT